MKNTNTMASNDSLVIAGAGADGHGVITGWRGDGAMTRARLVELAAAAGVPNEWLPAPKDSDVQLRRAVQKVANHTFIAKRIAKGRSQTVETRAWDSQHTLTRDLGVAPVAGAASGEIALVVTLYSDTGRDELVFDGDDALAAAVQREYDSLVGAELYQAADITRWLGEVHRYRLGAVRYGVGWYVPRASRQLAETITDVFASARWGTDWMNPPLPVATSAQLAAGLAIGLCTEVDEVLAQLATARERARERGSSDIGKVAAETYMVRFTRVLARAHAYAHLIGDSFAVVANAVHDAMVELDGVLDGGVDATTLSLMNENAKRDASAAIGVAL